MEKVLFLFILFIVPTYCVDIFKIYEIIYNTVKKGCVEQYEGQFINSSVEMDFEIYEKSTQTINKTFFLEEMNVGLKNNNLDNVFDKYCNKLNYIILKANTSINMLHSCINNRDIIEIKELIVVIKELKDYGCSNKRDLFKLFFTKGIECMYKHQYELSQCSKNEMTEFTSDTPISEFNENICK